jgi:GT2 family glycosyltransferase
MVSVIIVNYNGKDVIRDCLRSLEEQTFEDYEVILVDNGSTDGSGEYMEGVLRASPMAGKVKFSPLSENTGFAGGNLAGLKHAAGEYIALLNSDTEPDRNWLLSLVEAMDGDAVTGICASRLIDVRTGLIDSAGDGYTMSLKGFKRGEGERESARFSRKEYVFGACAGAALYRRGMIEEIGFLDEDFFLIHEDTDLNFRAQLGGWKVLYVPEALVLHKVRSSIGQMSQTAVYYTLRNSELVRIKNVPTMIFLICLPEFVLGTITEFLYFVVKHRRLRLYARAKLDAMKMVPAMLKKRKEIAKNRKTENGYLLRMMTPIWRGGILKSKLKKLIYG